MGLLVDEQDGGGGRVEVEPDDVAHDLNGDYFQRSDPDKTNKRLLTQLERLGHTIVLQQAA